VNKGMGMCIMLIGYLGALFAFSMDQGLDMYTANLGLTK